MRKGGKKWGFKKLYIKTKESWKLKIDAKHTPSVLLWIIYLAFCWNFFAESVLQYFCTFKNFEKKKKKKRKSGEK